MGNHISYNFTITDTETRKSYKTGYFYFINTYLDLIDFIKTYFGFKVSRIFVLDKKQRMIDVQNRLFDYPKSVYIEIDGITRKELIFSY